MAANREAPIKAGSGYIEIVPTVSREATTKMRAALVRQMETTGEEAGQAFSKAAASGMKRIPQNAATVAKKARSAVEKEATDSRVKLRQIERHLTKVHGEESGKQFRMFRNLAKQRQEMEQGTSKATRKAIADVVRADRQAVQDRIRAARELAQQKAAAERQGRLETRLRVRAERTEERALSAEVRQMQRELAAERRQQAQERAAQERQGRLETRLRVRAERTEERALAAEVRQVKRELAAEMRAQAKERALLERQARAATRARLQDELAAAQATRQALQTQLAQQQAVIRQMQAAHAGLFATVRKGWKKSGEHLEKYGTGAAETGNLITHKLIGPVSILSAGLSAIGVKSADSLIQAQTGLHGMGLAVKDVNSLLKEMQAYAIKTPYSLQDMQKYSTRYARALASHDQDFQSDDPKRKRKGSKHVADKAGDIVQMIGDQAAFGGIMDPTMVSQGMYAAEVILDMGRTPMRNMKQLERATGIPANELARMYGFQDHLVKDPLHPGEQKIETASAQMYEFMQDAKNTGGIEGNDLINKLLDRWENEKNGIKGSAARMGGATISGRIEQMKESGQVALGKIFYSEGKDGKFEYTGVGQAIMGKKTAVRDKNGKVVKNAAGETQYEYKGGLLGEAKQIGKGALRLAPQLLEEFFDTLKMFTGWLKWTVNFVRQHPGLRSMLLTAAKFAAVSVPLLLGIGLLSKLVGKLVKAASPAVSLVKGSLKGVRGLYRTTNQALSGVTAGRGNYLRTYRERRADYHGGDDRSMARRGWDRARGQDSRAQRLQIQTEGTQRELREVDERIEAIKRRLREVNTAPLDTVTRALGGPSGSVSSAGRDASSRAEGLHRNLGEVNNAPLGEVQTRLGGVKEKAESAERHVRQVHDAVRDLNGGKLGLVRQQFEYLKTKADAAKSHADGVSDKVKEINGRSLGQIRRRFADSLTPAVKGSYGQSKNLNDKIRDVNGRGLGQVTGRVRTLGGALEGAAKKAEDLRKKIDGVNRSNGGDPGGSSGGARGSGPKPPKPKKHAMGGIIPGYAPGVDDVPALLSRGEAILRPEVAHHLGADRINRWNAAAARGHLSRHARGTAGRGTPGRGVWPLSIVDELWSSINMGPSLGAFDGGLLAARAGAGIGGPTGDNTRSWGARLGGDAAGRGALNRFSNLREFAVTRVPQLLRIPPTGVSQAVSLVAGAVAPSAGRYAWDDIWKGEGNIVQRGQTFAGHMLNPSSIWQMIKDGAGSVWDQIKDIGGLIKRSTEDPSSVLAEGIEALRAMVTELISGVQDSVKAVQDMISNPSEFAQEVFESFWERAREAMPNTTGLFDFANGGVVGGYSPGNDRVHLRASPGEGILRPEATRFLGHRTIAWLNRGAKNGTLAGTAAKQAVSGQSLAGGGSVVTPAPDADAAESAVQRIRTALDSMTKAVQEHQAAATAAWSKVSTAVRTAVDSEIIPAQQRWAQHLTGPLTGAEQSFQSSHAGVWSAVQSRVASATSSSLGEFSRLSSGAERLRGVFESSGSSIRSSWSSSMSVVDRATRSTIDGPYNAGAVPMLAAMAKLAGASAPLAALHFSLGGVVPGYAPGVDDVPALLSRGEGVLRPEVVRALGVDTIHQWNDMARRGGNVFANGGIVNGASWVERHKDDPYSGYADAIGKGWGEAIAPAVKQLADSAIPVNRLTADDFSKGKPWLEAWGKFLDDHVGGGGKVAEVARREFATQAPAVGGARYTGGSFEQWCADFVSFVVDAAGANSRYGGSPHGAPANRWPAVAQWNAAMQHVPVSSARPGDLLTYNGDGHINIMVGPDETIGGNESNQLKHTRGYNRSATAALRPTGSDDSSGLSFNPWPGSIPKTLFDGGGGVGSGQLTEWIQAAMRATGVSGGAWLRGLITLVMRESNGNPRAVNNWDSNAASGTPSKGLAQVIDPTFRAYHQAGTSWDIFDPVANLSASINYIRSVYHDISNVQQADPNKPSKGYWTGTKSATAGLAMVGERGPELVDFRGGERVYNNRDTHGLLGPRYEIHIHEAKAEDTTQAVLRAMQYAEAMMAH
ncbi:transglycosylase SLT domain-containing protein [Streptomyces luteireticuli]|uniref:Transglycosylase SLT domain-containing protein n=1 Tax=Streptomyces luteireticuli TaxID=173858 RepID=A0ABP3ILL8_9ACTN